MPHAKKVARRIQKVEVGEWPSSRGVEPKIMAIQLTDWLPTKTNFVDVARADFGEIEARLYR